MNRYPRRLAQMIKIRRPLLEDSDLRHSRPLNVWKSQTPTPVSSTPTKAPSLATTPPCLQKPAMTLESYQSLVLRTPSGTLPLLPSGPHVTRSSPACHQARGRDCKTRRTSRPCWFYQLWSGCLQVESGSNSARVPRFCPWQTAYDGRRAI